MEKTNWSKIALLEKQTGVRLPIGAVDVGSSALRLMLERDGFVLYVLLPRPDARAARAVAAQEIEYALRQYSDLIFVFVHLKTLPWMDVPFTIHLTAPEYRDVLEDISGGYAFKIVLVNSETGAVEALRELRAAPEFCARLRGAIGYQAQCAFDAQAYARDVARVYEQASTEELLRRSGARYSTGSESPELAPAEEDEQVFYFDYAELVSRIVGPVENFPDAQVSGISRERLIKRVIRLLEELPPDLLVLCLSEYIALSGKRHFERGEFDGVLAAMLLGIAYGQLMKEE